jgi:hypothetical protein
MSDAALSAFSVFFMQSPSFLDDQKMMEKERGKNNAQSLFGVHLIPKVVYNTNHRLKKWYFQVTPSLLLPANVLRRPIHNLAFQSHYFSSQTIHCDCCSTQSLKNGKTHYSHVAVTPVIVSPKKLSVLVGARD